MKEHELISLFIAKNQSISNMWGLYAVIILGVLGFLIQKNNTLLVKEKIVLTVVMIVIFISNALPIYFSARSLQWLSNQIDKDVFLAINPEIVISLHILFDILFIVFLWNSNKLLNGQKVIEPHPNTLQKPN